MKKVAFIAKQVLTLILVFAMISLSSGLLKAQDTLAKKPQKVIKIKVDTDEGGESFTIDTTFVIENDLDMEKFQLAMQEYEMKMQDAYLHSPRMKYLFRNAKEPRCYEQFHRQGDRQFIGRPDVDRGPVRIVAPKRGETLSDVLGDIPMSAVISYKIKETKNGKRITIEVSDDAIFDHNNDIIIWQGDVPPSPPPPPPPPPPQPQIKKEVLNEKNLEKEETPEDSQN